MSHMCQWAELGNDICLDEVRDLLRRAAALLCTRSGRHASIAHYLVTLPFQIFTRESISIGVPLWLGVMHENPRMEPKLLAEITAAWDKTIQRGVGLFDPFFE